MKIKWLCMNGKTNNLKYCFRFQELNTMSFNLLGEQQNEHHSSASNLTKLRYVQAEKAELEIIVKQYEEQIKLQRSINQQLSNSRQFQQSQVISTLALQNKLLEEHYSRIKQQNQQFSLNILIQQQVNEEYKIECSNYFKEYEDKIIELRRLIQAKQSSIQSLEEKHKFQDEGISTPPTNVTILFFSEVEELKKTIKALSFKNKELTAENEALVKKNSNLQTKIELIESLTLKSKLTYEQFKYYYSAENKVNRKSAPKRDTYIPLQQKLSLLKEKHLNEAYTREVSEISTSQIDHGVKMMVYKYYQQSLTLQKELIKLRQSQKHDRKAKNHLIQSYKNLEVKILKISQQLQYYKKSTQDLLKLLAFKKNLNRAKSAERLKIHQFIEEVRHPKQIIYTSERANIWKKMKQGVKIQKIKLLQVKRKYKGFYRSLSCVGDYRRIVPDEIDKFLCNYNQQPKKKQMSSNGKNYEYNTPQKTYTQDFSYALDPFDQQFSIISSKNPKISYSEWKKSNKKKTMNLTVIQENIL